VGGIVVGALSGSQSSVAGPAAGLTAIVAAQINALKAFETFLLALVLAGVIQVVLGSIRAGAVSAFFPSSVIKGLLAAIGVILILKQIPHILGHDSDPEGEMSFEQPDHENTFTELSRLFFGEVHQGALVIGLVSIAILVLWDRNKKLKKSPIPSALVVVVLGVLMSEVMRRMGGAWTIESSHLVEVPVADKWQDLIGFLRFPDWSQIQNPAVYTAALTIAAVASLETLLNLEAIDKIDPQQRVSPPNRELIAQGIGNMACGLIGGIPITSVIVRSSVNINAGGRTKLSTVFHGFLLVFCVALLPTYLNFIPLSCLAAILFVTGFKLASPKLIMQMYREGLPQWFPFVATLVAIVFTDLIVGVVIGLAISVAFILRSNMRRPINQVIEKHISGEVVHLKLANQVSFLNRAVLDDALNQAKPGSDILLDAEATDYIDPDVLSLIRDYIYHVAPVRGIRVSTRGFEKQFGIPDKTQYAEYTTRQLQQKLSPSEVLHVLREGNQRFRTGNRLTRDWSRQMIGTAVGQNPLAVVISCIDSRSPAEIIFDLGLGDIFTIRIAGNVVRTKVLGSMEYGCKVAGAKLILVMGHTKCGAVTASVGLTCDGKNTETETGCEHLDLIVQEIRHSIPVSSISRFRSLDAVAQETFVDEVARENVLYAVQLIPKQSSTIRSLIAEGKVAIVGAMYDVSTGEIEFLTDHAIGLESAMMDRS
jgi:carbonic anhydrase/SulP family sulfate permease